MGFYKNVQGNSFNNGSSLKKKIYKLDDLYGDSGSSDTNEETDEDENGPIRSLIKFHLVTEESEDLNLVSESAEDEDDNTWEVEQSEDLNQFQTLEVLPEDIIENYNDTEMEPQLEIINEKEDSEKFADTYQQMEEELEILEIKQDLSNNSDVGIEKLEDEITFTDNREDVEEEEEVNLLKIKAELRSLEEVNLVVPSKGRKEEVKHGMTFHEDLDELEEEEKRLPSSQEELEFTEEETSSKSDKKVDIDEKQTSSEVIADYDSFYTDRTSMVTDLSKAEKAFRALFFGESLHKRSAEDQYQDEVQAYEQLVKNFKASDKIVYNKIAGPGIEEVVPNCITRDEYFSRLDSIRQLFQGSGKINKKQRKLFIKFYDKLSCIKKYKDLYQGMAKWAPGKVRNYCIMEKQCFEPEDKLPFQLRMMGLKYYRRPKKVDNLGKTKVLNKIIEWGELYKTVLVKTGFINYASDSMPSFRRLMHFQRFKHYQTGPSSIFNWKALWSGFKEHKFFTSYSPIEKYEFAVNLFFGSDPEELVSLWPNTHWFRSDRATTVTESFLMSGIKLFPQYFFSKKPKKYKLLYKYMRSPLAIPTPSDSGPSSHLTTPSISSCSSCRERENIAENESVSSKRPTKQIKDPNDFIADALKILSKYEIKAKKVKDWSIKAEKELKKQKEIYRYLKKNKDRIQCDLRYLKEKPADSLFTRKQSDNLVSDWNEICYNLKEGEMVHSGDSNDTIYSSAEWLPLTKSQELEGETIRKQGTQLPIKKSISSLEQPIEIDESKKDVPEIQVKPRKKRRNPRKRYLFTVDPFLPEEAGIQLTCEPKTKL